MADETTQATSAVAAKPQARFKRKLVGHVTSDKMDKTVVVEVVRYSRHPMYKKYVRTRAHYKVHDDLNTCKTGDRVEIEESRPMSREKRWKLVRVVKRAVTG